MGAQQSKDELLYQEVQNGNQGAVKALHRDGAGLEVGTHGGTPLHHAAKRGFDSTVALLLSHGANPLAINDDCQTPLDMARARDHINVVRIIEAQISLFCGTVRELSGPGFLESLAPQWLTKKIWAVVLPSGLNNPRRPPRFVLVIYPNPKVSQPRTIVSLSKVEIVEPNFSLADPMLVMFDKSTKTRYKFLSEHEGEKHQMQKLYGACRGIPQVVGGSNPLQPDLPAIAPPNVTIPEDVELAMAINASIQSASQEGIPLSPVSQQPSGTSDLNGWGNTSEGTSNGWGPPDMAEAPSKKDKYSGWSDEVGLTSHNGWGTAEAGPSTSETAEAMAEETTASASGPSVSGLV